MQKNYYLFLLLFIAAFLEFWHLGKQPVKEYDEARYGINAFEMLQNKDYVNLHYRGKPDAWVARPPLKAWLIITGYKIAGYNEWGLRLSSGLSILVFIFFAFRLVNLYLPDQQTFICCLMLLCVKGIIGFHVGRNADMDAELIALLTTATYFVMRFIDFNDTRSALWAGFFFGLSFWLKTMACFYYAPGLFLYILLTGKLNHTLRSSAFWKSAGIFFGLILSWFILLQICGATYDNKHGFHTYKNSWETMLMYDTWDRFTASNFDKHTVESNPLFFILMIDSIFNIWNYFFYAGIILYCFHRFYKNNKNEFEQSAFYTICTLSICIVFPIAVLLTFGMHKLEWYVSPTLLFLAVIATYALYEIKKVIPYTLPIISVVFLFAIGRHFLFLEEEIKQENEVYFLRENKALWMPADTIFYIDQVPQNVYLTLLWNHKILIPYNALTASANGVLLGPQSELNLKPSYFQIQAMSNKEQHSQELFLARIKSQNAISK